MALDAKVLESHAVLYLMLATTTKPAIKARKPQMGGAMKGTQ